MKKFYQQGDVFLKPTSKNIEGGKEDKSLILAEGEATGHVHRITDGLATLILFQDKKFLKIFSDFARLKHEEHDLIDLPKDDYEIGIGREYDHFDEEVREIRD